MTNVLSLRWLTILVLAVVAILAATKIGDIRLHLAAAAVVALVFAMMGIRDNAQLRAAGASEHAVGASAARHMALVWLWGAAILGLSYTLLLTPWREWSHFFAGFAVVGVLCLLFASALDRDAKSNSDDQTMLKLGRMLTIGPALGMLATLIGIAIDPDKSIVSKARPDWAANIVFVFGGLALLAICAYALWRQQSDASSR